MKPDHIRRASEAHCNLNIFYAVIAIMEGGCIYGEAANKTASKIIHFYKQESLRQLAVYDEAVAEARFKMVAE